MRVNGTISTNTAATGAPTITGTAQVDQTLTAVTTGILDADGLTSPTYTYQWIRGNGTEADISGANSSTYTLAAADEGKTIKVQVTFDDDAGTTETLTSAATATVVAATTDTTPPEVEKVGVVSAGLILTILFDEDLDEDAARAVPVSAYAVTADGQAVTILATSVAPGDTLILFPAVTISPGQTVVVSYTDPTTGNDTVALQDVAGNDVASFSVTANTPATGAPTITGTAQVDQTLTAVTTGIMDTDGLTSPTYTYQWIRGNGTEADISGANLSTYTLVAADEGKTIKVRVTFDDDYGTTETRTSAATAVVAAAADTPPEVVSVAVNLQGQLLTIIFDKALDEDAARAVPVSAYAVTADGQDVTILATSVFFGNTVVLSVPGAAIRQGQTVIVSYTDPTAGNDTVALQDLVGNDVASFTTGMSGVPAVTNGSTVPSTDTTPVFSQANALVSNVNVVGKFRQNLAQVGALEVAQGFRTGDNTGGYTLESIEIDFARVWPSRSDASNLRVTLWSATSGQRPAAVLATLTNPSDLSVNSGANVKRFTAPPFTNLNANTMYFVRLSFSGSSRLILDVLDSTGEDAGHASGWSINNFVLQKGRGSTADWSHPASGIVRIRVNGTAGATPDPDPPCAAPDLAGRERIWTGTVTVGPRVVGSTLTGHGFSTLYSVGTSLLPDRAFSIGSNDYAFIEIMALTTGDLRVRSDSVAGLTAAHRAALRLHVCDVDYDFSAASVSGRNYTWTDDLDWSTFSTRTLYLSLPDGYPEPPARAPGAPTGLSAQPVTGKPGYLRLSWTPGSAPGGSLPPIVTDYEARYRKTGATNWSPMWSFRNYGTPGFDYPSTTHAVPRGGNDAPLIYYLDPNTEYEVQVRAINAYGESGWSNQVSATTAQATTANDDGTADADNGSGPAAAPSQPTVRRVANEPGLMVRWNAPRTAAPAGTHHTGYEVEIEKERERDRRITTTRKSYLYQVGSDILPPPTQLVIATLEPNTTYTVRVRAVSVEGMLVGGVLTITSDTIYSPWSPDQSGTTATVRANNIQLSLEFPDGTRSTTVAPGAEVTLPGESHRHPRLARGAGARRDRQGPDTDLGTRATPPPDELLPIDQGDLGAQFHPPDRLERVPGGRVHRA